MHSNMSSVSIGSNEMCLYFVIYFHTEPPGVLLIPDVR
jgi:hypothetical protein